MTDTACYTFRNVENLALTASRFGSTVIKPLLTDQNSEPLVIVMLGPSGSGKTCFVFHSLHLDMAGQGDWFNRYQSFKANLQNRETRMQIGDLEFHHKDLGKSDYFPTCPPKLLKSVLASESGWSLPRKNVASVPQVHYLEHGHVPHLYQAHVAIFVDFKMPNGEEYFGPVRKCVDSLTRPSKPIASKYDLLANEAIRTGVLPMINKVEKLARKIPDANRSNFSGTDNAPGAQNGSTFNPRYLGFALMRSTEPLREAFHNFKTSAAEFALK